MTRPDPSRAVDIKAIHAMKRELAMTDDCYRALVSRVSDGTTETSAALSSNQRRVLKDELRRLGAGRHTQERFRPQADKGRPFRPARTDQQAMIRGLWAELAGLGRLKDTSEDALAAFILRQAKVDALQFVGVGEAQAVITALKAWMRRARG